MLRDTGPLRRFAVLCAVVVTFATSPFATDVFAMPRQQALTLFAMALLLLALPVLPGLLATHRTTFLVIGSFMGGLTLAALLSRQQAFQTIYGVIGRCNGWLSYTGLAVVLAAAALAFDRRTAATPLRALVGTGLAMGAYGVVQLTGHDPIDWHRQFFGRLLGTLGNPDFTSAFFGLSAVAALWAATHPQHRRLSRIGAGFATIGLVYLAHRTTAAQGELAFLVGASVLVGVRILDPLLAPRWQRLRVPYFTAVAVAGALGVAGLSDHGPLAARLYDASWVNRLYTWEAAITMFRHHPLTGVGIEAYGDWYRVSRSDGVVQTFGDSLHANEGHSVLLTLMGTGGLLLAIPYVVLWAYAIRTVLRAARHPEARSTAAGLLGVVSAYLVDSLFTMDQLGVAVWGWLLGGAAIAALREPEPVFVGSTPRPHRAARSVAAALIAAGGLTAVAYPWWFDMRLGAASSMPANTAQERDAAIRAVLDAAAETPEPIRLLGALDRLREMHADAELVTLADQSVVRFPREFLLWEYLAEFHESKGDPAAAVPLREHMRVLDPLNRGNIAKLQADRNAARR